MDAVFYRHLTDSHPLLREHVRMGESLGTLSAMNASVPPAGIASGFAVLDAFLPWRGWPPSAMTEIMTDMPGCGELSLLMPAMARLTQQKRPILCIGAPHELFGPALLQAGIDPAFVTQIHPAPSSSTHQRENLWATEQALRTGLPGMVVLWSPPRATLAPEILRRLHLACMSSQSTIGQSGSPTPATMLIHFRGAGSMSQPSPAWLRFGYAADDRHIRLQVLKCRGRELTRPLITLDRAAVQDRLFGQLRAARWLDNMIEFGTTALVDVVAASQCTDDALETIASQATASMQRQPNDPNRLTAGAITGLDAPRVLASH
ncbi:MAG: hypothetical protein JNL19_08815 [Burkholderiales bacterium]|nr:hypothetical protein [Burkholderiales bacterium]